MNQLLRSALKIALIILMLPITGWGQNNLDSLHLSLKALKGVDKAKKMLELANYYKSVFPDSSVYYANQALNMGEIEKDILIQAKSYSTLGETFQIKNQLDESIESYFKAIEIAEKNGEKTSLGTSYNGLGISFYYLNDLEKAELYIKKGAELKLELKDYTYYSVITTNLAAIYFYNQKYTEAIEILKEAEKVLLKDNQEFYLATVYNSLGGAYQMAYSELDSAEYFYQRSLEIAIKHNINNSIITGYHNLGELSFVRKNYKLAIDNLKKAEQYCLETKNNTYALSVYTTLSEVYDTIGDYENAFRTKSLQMAFKDSIFQTQKQKTVDELEIKFQTAKNEQKIQQQQQQIQNAKLLAEQEKNKTNIVLFISFVMLLTAAFILLYIFQRKSAKEKLQREKSKLFENIVHEIRTPLTLINGPLQIVKKEMKTHPELNAHIEMIENNSEKLIRLVNELLDVSKLDKGKYQLSYQNGDLNTFITKIIKSFESDSQQKQIQLVFSPLTPSQILNYPSNALEQVLENLIGNALKYCPENSVVTVSIQKNENQIAIKVSDNGKGIPENEQQKVFERFYQLKNASSSKGTGIGLSMVKELSELMKGSVTLESKEGKGATFIVTFPVATIEKQTLDLEIDESKPHLLIVDDEEEILTFVSGLLNKDFNISTAKNGQIGLEKVNEIVPDIVLSDIMMPIKDGIDLLQEIKANELTNHIPVVIFSAKSSLESRLEGLSYGADVYIPKPFNPDELLLTIKNLFKTIQRNQQDFKTGLKEEKTFEERIFTSNDYVNKTIQFVIDNLTNEAYSVNELAADLCISRSQLHRKLTTLTGFSATNFIKMVRLEKAKDMLRSNWGNVTEVAYACGFNSQSYFTKSFTEYFGESPSKV
jgi:two-component system, sensor histidine kinase ChiS